MASYPMTIDEAVEVASRAICADDGSDPDEKLEWGPYVGGSAFRVNPPKERWKCVADNLYIRQIIIGLVAVGFPLKEQQRHE